VTELENDVKSLQVGLHDIEKVKTTFVPLCFRFKKKHIFEFLVNNSIIKSYLYTLKHFQRFHIEFR